MMPSYLLLRDNKQTGPYSLNDLIAHGLKAYDLVWVDGRSAAWRYPSEIAELKQFAPTVEEQPFDRFYKKNNQPAQQQVAEEKTETISADFRQQPVEKQEVKVETREKEIKHEPVHVQKHIYVSLPDNNGAQHTEKIYQQYDSYLPKADKKTNDTKPENNRSYSAISVHESDETKLETKYSQSLEEIKEMYVNTLVQRKTRSRRKEVFKKYGTPVLGALVLLLAGVVIGYIFTHNTNAIQSAQITPATNPEKKATLPGNDEGDYQPGSEEQDYVLPNKGANLALNQKSFLTPEKRQTKIGTKTGSYQPDNTSVYEKQVEKETPKNNDDEVVKVEKRNSEINSSTGERTKAIRGETQKENIDKDDKPTQTKYKFLDDDEDLGKLVTVKSNNYVRGAFGGIRDLQLTLVNDSKYLLDAVQVELQIMKPSQQPLKTDIITFRNVTPNGTMTVKVPDSQRGIRVEYRIRNIESKQWASK